MLTDNFLIIFYLPQAPYFLIYILSFFDESLGLILPGIGKRREFNNTPSIEVLKINYTDFDKTFADYGHSLIYYGHVKKLPGYVPPSENWTPATW